MLGFLNPFCMGVFAELPEHRRHSSPHTVLVHDVVMNQKCRMQQFNRGGDFERCVSGPAPGQFVAQKDKTSPYKLPALCKRTKARGEILSPPIQEGEFLATGLKV